MRISIVTVNLNNGELLGSTIKSVVEQTYANLEYIVIDGGSTDQSLAIINAYQESIDYWISEPDRGIYHAMNKAISVATGEFVLFLNSGDSFVDNEVLTKVSEYLQADFVCGQAYLQSNSDKVLWFPPNSVDEFFFLQRFSVCHQSMFIRLALLKQRAYKEKYRIVADYEQMFYEMIVNQRSYSDVPFPIANFASDGISSDHLKSDLEKQKVIEEFRYFDYVKKDELYELTAILKIGTKKYNIAVFLLYVLVNGTRKLRRFLGR